jgi:hypothetical protein
MRTFIFRCPTTMASVQGACSEEPCPGPYYVAQHCLACGGLHLVNPATGKLLAEESVPPASRGRLQSGAIPVQSGTEKSDSDRNSWHTLAEWGDRGKAS